MVDCEAIPATRSTRTVRMDFAICHHVSHQHDHVTPFSLGRDTTVYGQRSSLKNIVIVEIFISTVIFILTILLLKS